jgi:hypothetical protein
MPSATMRPASRGSLRKGRGSGRSRTDDGGFAIRHRSWFRPRITRFREKCPRKCPHPTGQTATSLRWSRHGRACLLQSEQASSRWCRRAAEPMSGTRALLRAARPGRAAELRAFRPHPVSIRARRCRFVLFFRPFACRRGGGGVKTLPFAKARHLPINTRFGPCIP